MWKIKIDRADTIFSQFIRIRDGRCMRCGSPVAFNGAGMPVSHQCSHYFSRGRESTRFNPENADTFCFTCHELMEKEKQDKKEYRGEYTMFKVRQLGENGFKILKMLAYSYKRKDRKQSLMIVKALLKSLNQQI